MISRSCLAHKSISVFLLVDPIITKKCPTRILSSCHCLFTFHSSSSLASTNKKQETEVHVKLTHKDWLSRNQVLDVFEKIEDPNAVITIWNHYSKRKDYKPNEPIFALVVTKLAEAKNFDAIEDIMRKIKLERPCRLSDDFFYNVIKIYARLAGRIRREIEVLYDMPMVYNCWPTVRTFNLVLNVLVSNRLFSVVREVYTKAPMLGVEVDACCLNILIKGLCENGDLEVAFHVLDEFPRQRCRPNERTYSTLMHALCEKGKLEEAFGLLERMENEGIEPDTVAFNVLISGLRKQGKVDEGMAVLEGMKGKGCEPNAGSYQEVLYGLLDLKRFVEAKELMGRMIGGGMCPSFLSYKKLIDGICKERLLGDVDLALMQMVGQGFVPKMGMWRQMVESVFSGNKSCNHASTLGKIIGREQEMQAFIHNF